MIRFSFDGPRHARQDLTREEEHDLFERGDIDTIVGRNLPLVIEIAKRFRIDGVTMGELISEGSVALLRAARKFDHRRGLKFSSYLYPSVYNELRRLRRKTSRRWDAEACAYQDAYDMRGEERDSDMRDGEAWAGSLELLRAALPRLTPRQRRVIELRWLGPRKTTLRVIARSMRVTSERVRQIERSAFQGAQRGGDDVSRGRDPEQHELLPGVIFLRCDPVPEDKGGGVILRDPMVIGHDVHPALAFNAVYSEILVMPSKNLLAVRTTRDEPARRYTLCDC